MNAATLNSLVRSLLAVILWALIAPWANAAQDTPTVPLLTGRVVDNAELFSSGASEENFCGAQSA